MKNLKSFFNAKSLSLKIQRINVISIAVTVTIASVFALVTSTILVNETSIEIAEGSLGFLSKEMNAIGESLVMKGTVMGTSQELINGIKEGKADVLLAQLTQYKSALNLETATIVDTKGDVLMRVHNPDKKGDNLAGQQNVKNAIQGTSSFEIEVGTTVKYAVKAGIPIKDEAGQIIGAFTLGYQLDHPEFLDALKESTGDEYTIFFGDERLNTTIMDKGERVLGTKLDPKIADIVIKQKKEYTGKAKLFGETYTVAYKPIFSNDGSTITGVVSSAKLMKSILRRLNNSIIAIIAISIILIVSSLYLVSRFIKKNIKLPLENMVEVSSRLSKGDIEVDVKVNSEDEMGKLASAFNKMIDTIKEQAKTSLAIAEGDLTQEYKPHSEKDVMGTALEKTLKDLNIMFSAFNTASRQVNMGADQVSVSAQSLSQGATQQASAIEELASTIEHIAGQVKKNAESTSKVKNLITDTSSEVSNGNKQMAEMLKAMNDINNSSSEISKIIKVIDDIAFQTNILALNAAVEAARAGAAGKGFAVVADEVRNLAGKSAQAAKNTTELIEDSIIKVQEGTVIANSTANSLNEIVKSVDEISNLIVSIDKASEQQSSSIQEVTLGIEQISTVVQTNSATAEESAAASEELSGQATMLGELIAKIKLNKEYDDSDAQEIKKLKSKKIDLDMHNNYKY